MFLRNDFPTGFVGVRHCFPECSWCC